MHQVYSSSVSPFQAKTGTPVAAMLHKIQDQVFEIHQALRNPRSSSMILGRENILEQIASAYQLKNGVSKHYTGGPGHFRTENDESFDQDCSLNRPLKIKSDKKKQHIFINLTCASSQRCVRLSKAEKPCTAYGSVYR
jgi:hypothetical protein